MFIELELNKDTLSNMYRGSMLKGDSLARIADYLDCSVDYLLGRTDERTGTYHANNVSSSFVQNDGAVTLGSVSVSSAFNSNSNDIASSKEESLEEELQQSMKQMEKEIEKLEINTLFSGKYDSNNAILTLHPGAGGTESCDWAQMLYRMYTRWALSNDFEIKELDYLDGEEAGLKSVTFLVSGDYAYGYLKGEMGVHRLVRISTFDSNKRRYKSFASIILKSAGIILPAERITKSPNVT